MKKIIFNIIKVVGIIYIVICGLLYFFQEKLIFFPEKLDKNFQFGFDQKFEEFNIQTSDHKILNAVLFKADSSKGLIFYLHGNGGSLRSWGDAAKTYTAMGYDVFMPDYRGYGKSEGDINNQQQMFGDVQLCYDSIKRYYAEDKIVVLGYSIGTGPAAKLASVNHPKLLILQAPYYSLTDMMRHEYAVMPTFILKYKFSIHEYLENCKMPVVIFHGDVDEVIYYGSSLKLEKEFKPADTLITLHGQMHNGISDNVQYKEAIKKLLLPD